MLTKLLDVLFPPGQGWAVTKNLEHGFVPLGKFLGLFGESKMMQREIRSILLSPDCILKYLLALNLSSWNDDPVKAGTFVNP